MKYLNKLSLIVIIYFAAIFVTACRCDDVEFPYYDFGSIEFEYVTGKSIDSNSVFAVRIIENDLVFLAESKIDFGFINSAYATQPCPQDGESGRKFNVVDIQVTSSADYDAEHPAGTSLNDIFKYGSYNVNSGGYDLLPLSNLSDEELGFTVYFGLDEAPTVDDTHIFTFTLTKDNGTDVVGTTDLITWN